MGKTIAEVLDQVAAAAESMMDSAHPSDEHSACPMCTLKATSEQEHDPDCAYRIVRTQISPDDIARVRRLARTMRYEKVWSQE